MSRSPLLDHQKNKHELFEKLIAKRDAQKVDRSGLKKRLEYLEELKQRQSNLRQLFYTSFSFLPRPRDTRDYNISVEEFKKEFPLLNEYDKEQRHLVKKKENLELSINKIDRKFNDLRRWMYTDIHDNISRIEDMLEKTKSRSRSRSKSRSRSRSRSRSG